jgi:hypothetical protein
VRVTEGVEPFSEIDRAGEAQMGLEQRRASRQRHVGQRTVRSAEALQDRVRLVGVRERTLEVHLDGPFRKSGRRVLPSRLQLALDLLG